MTIFLVAASVKDIAGGASRSESAAVFWDEREWWGTTYLSPFQSNVKFRFGTTQSYNWPSYTRPAGIGSTFTLTAAQKDGTTDSLYVNGNLVLSEGGKLGTLSGGAATGFIGRGYDFTYFPGDIAEIVIYGRALPEAERTTVEEYLRNKYRLFCPVP